MDKKREARTDSHIKTPTGQSTHSRLLGRYARKLITHMEKETRMHYGVTIYVTTNSRGEAKCQRGGVWKWVPWEAIRFR